MVNRGPLKTGETPLSAAERMAEINSSDYGTWGGNVTELIYDIKEMKPEDKLLFIELYLARERLQITQWLFKENNR